MSLAQMYLPHSAIGWPLICNIGMSCPFQLVKKRLNAHQAAHVISLPQLCLINLIMQEH